MTEQYAEAVEWLKQLLQPYVKKGRIDLGTHEPSEIFFRFALRIVWLADEKGGYFYCHPSALNFLVTEASRDPGAFRLLADICAAHIFRSEVVPEAAKNFAALVLTGQTSFPKRSSASKTFAKNLFLLAAAEACARDFSLSLTRNDEAKHATSACDAVSEALSALGFGVTWRAIKELFTHKSSTRLRISAEQIRHEVIEIQEQFPEAAKEWARMVNRKLSGTECIAEPPP